MRDQAMRDRVDQYFGGKLLGSDATLDDTLAASEAAALPGHRRIAAAGPVAGADRPQHPGPECAGDRPLGGYSTICLGRGVGPDGRVVSLEYEPRHAQVARSSIAAAGLWGVVEVRFGRALDLLPGLREDGIGPLDLVFIDADKEGNADYVDWAIR